MLTSFKAIMILAFIVLQLDPSPRIIHHSVISDKGYGFVRLPPRKVLNIEKTGY